WRRCAAEVKTSFNGMRSTLRRKRPKPISLLRRACQILWPRPSGARHRPRSERKPIFGRPASSGRPGPSTAIRTPSLAWKGTSWMTVDVTPLRRRLKFNAITSTCLMSVTDKPSGRPASSPGDGEDFVALGTAGCIHLDRIADFLADQRARDGGGDGDAALLHIGFLV